MNKPNAFRDSIQLAVLALVICRPASLSEPRD
jgi:hypothetical protein